MRGDDVLHFDNSQKLAWRELYRTLIMPARKLLPEKTGDLLTVIPHGPLFRLSFAALLDRDRYLIERYRLHYAPAGAVCASLQKSRKLPLEAYRGICW